MKREIKYRAWDGKNMYMLSGIDWEGYIDNRIRSVRLSPVKDGGELIPTETDPNDLVLLQYTGYKNISGEEIYEGDILEISICSYGYDCGEHLTYVEFQDGKFDVEDIRFPLSKHFEFARVVGNIYQNPELLK